MPADDVELLLPAPTQTRNPKPMGGRLLNSLPSMPFYNNNDTVLPMFTQDITTGPKESHFSFGGYLLTGVNCVLGGIEYVAEIVGDVFGVTSPRYELFIEDSLRYNEEVIGANTACAQRRSSSSRGEPKNTAKYSDDCRFIVIKHRGNDVFLSRFDT